MYRSNRRWNLLWRFRGGALCAATLTLATLTAAQAAPKQLYGKSVTVSWSESRNQRPAGEQNFRTVTVNLQRSVYISTAGRLFSRHHAMVQRGRKARSGQTEGVGSSGTNLSGGARDARFQGNDLIISSAFTGAARQIVISFDGGGCTARVIIAKQVGAKTASLRGVASGGRQIEVESAQAGAASCSVRDGNVFGG